MRRILLAITLAVVVWPHVSHATLQLEDQGKARARCEADKAALLKAIPGILPGNVGRDCTVEGESGSPRTFTCEYQGPSPRWCGNWGSPALNEKWYSYPAGKTCANRLKTPSGLVNAATASTVCHDGCLYTLQDATEDYTLRDVQSNAINAKRGRYAPTGATCGLPTDPVKPPYTDDFCQDLGGGYMQCRKPGKTCLKSPAGREYCWGDGESGPAVEPSRKDGASKSTDAPAPGLPATAPVARPGENWSPNGPSSSVTNNTTNTTNNITNYTNTGTPNTIPGSGTSGDGSDNPGNGESGDGEEGEDNGLSGGSGCDDPPVPTGDQLLAGIVFQSWKNNCNHEQDRNSLASVEGVSGSDEGIVEGIWADGPELPELDGGMISIGGGQLFPNVEIEGQSWNVPPAFYDAIDRIKFLIIAACTIIAMFIVGRNI